MPMDFRRRAVNQGWWRRGESSRHRDISPASFAKLIPGWDCGAGWHMHRRIDIYRPVSCSGGRVRIALDVRGRRRLVCEGESRRVSRRFDTRREQNSRRWQRRWVLGRARRLLIRRLQNALNERNRGHSVSGDSRRGGRFFNPYCIRRSRLLTTFRRSGIERSLAEMLAGERRRGKIC